MQLFESFISYRRSESLAEVQNIYHSLMNKGFSTFCDIYELDRGRFDKNILQNIKNCTNFILVLHPHSLDRCINENDWLRFEIKNALELKKNIICVFVGEFSFPVTLPEDIDDIRYYNGPKYDFEYFNSFIEALCARFLVKSDEIEISNVERDFVVVDSTLIKYIGHAPIVSIPNGVKIIEKNAFKDKTHITDITIPEGVEEIGDSAFARCISITSLVFPNSLKHIGNKAFLRCYNLAFIAFNDSIEAIGEEAFGFCGKLKVVRLGKGISNISYTAFNNCDKLSLFDVDPENNSFSCVDGILYDKERKSIIRCPEGYSNDLIVVPDEVEDIMPWCFSKCLNTIDIVLPKHLKRVGAYAFNDCTNIISLTLGDEVEEFDITAIDGWGRGQRVVVSKRFNHLIKYQIDQKMGEKVELLQTKEFDAPDNIMIKTTFESTEEAAKMARMLVSNRFVAAAQIDKLNVFYTWNDETCNENEFELSCITKGKLYKTVEDFIMQHHSFDCCQIIGIPISNTSKQFGDWVAESTLE